MLGVDDRLVPPGTMKWVQGRSDFRACHNARQRSSFIYVLGMAVDSAFLAWLQ